MHGRVALDVRGSLRRRRPRLPRGLRRPRPALLRSRRGRGRLRLAAGSGGRRVDQHVLERRRRRLCLVRLCGSQHDAAQRLRDPRASTPPREAAARSRRTPRRSSDRCRRALAAAARASPSPEATPSSRATGSGRSFAGARRAARTCSSFASIRRIRPPTSSSTRRPRRGRCRRRSGTRCASIPMTSRSPCPFEAGA